MSIPTNIPADKKLDSTFSFLAEGYPFISTRCRRYNSDLFRARLMLKKVVCVSGRDAARMFYHPGRFTRKGAMPPTTLWLLQDKGSVQLKNEEAHRHRKQLFMSLLDNEGTEKLAQSLRREWLSAFEERSGAGQVRFHDEMRRILTRAACAWAGFRLTRREADARSQEFSAMIDGAGSAGPRNWRGLRLRKRSERWAMGVIERLRRHEAESRQDTPVRRVAWFRDLDGRLLDSEVAAVELLNLLRPTVAVARFATFAALALHEHPECRKALADQERNGGDKDHSRCFAQEVRRYYPFFPCIGGRAREAFEWRNFQFEEGTWFLLDLYGTNHDPALWQNPEQFEPLRFKDWTGDPWSPIAQGAGDYDRGHRCPGEPATVELISTTAELLAAIDYQVPEQDLSIDLSHMPAIPADGFIMSQIRMR